MSNPLSFLLRGLGLLIVLAVTALIAFSIGAVVGKYRPQLAQPWSDYAFQLLLPFSEAYCDVADVTRCGVSRADREDTSCDPFTSEHPRRAVFFVFGQSNSANFGEIRYTAGDSVVNFNPHDGKCYQTRDPLFGADGDGGSVWGRLGDKLVANGLFDSVLIASFGIGGTSLGEWTTNGRLHPRVEYAARQLENAGIKPTHVLWHQGENDSRNGTSAADYRDMFAALVDSLRDYGIDAPVFPAVATICADLGSKEIRKAQRMLPDVIEGVYPGADSDTLTDMSDRHDFCHFSGVGLDRHAELWLEVMESFEAKNNASVTSD